MSNLDKVSIIALFILVYLTMGLIWGNIYTNTRDNLVNENWKEFTPTWWENQKLREK